MPLQYTGIIDEHQAVRTSAGIFDISHLGRIEVAGPKSLSFLQRLLTNDLSVIKVGQAQYTLLCRQDGGILDDLMVFYTQEDHYLLISNAVNTAKDLDWLKEHAPPKGVSINDLSEKSAMLALQGPSSPEVLSRIMKSEERSLPRRFHCSQAMISGKEVQVCRTGYTGEDGFELIAASKEGRDLWTSVLEAGAKPCGLGARDTLRLEAAFLLYGKDIDETVNPLEAALERFVPWNQGDFMGKEALLGAKAQGPRRRLVGFKVKGRGVARSGHTILHNGRELGKVTSGTFSPTLNASIGMAYVPPELSTVGAELDIDIRGNPVKAQVVPRPFYQRPR